MDIFFTPILLVLQKNRDWLTGYQILNLLAPAIRDQLIDQYGEAGVGGGKRPGAAATVSMICNKLLSMEDGIHIAKDYLGTVGGLQFTYDGTPATPSHAERCAIFKFVA